MHQGDSQHRDIQQPQEESTPLKQLEEFHRFMTACKDCQQEVEPHWQFCAHCGERLATHCPGCGTPLPPAGAPSCLHCGLEIPQG